ncbi:uncharacterized protein PRCAT00001390001 [Priceomyces carsonii]|uniref:uncharacterized protein n=1 Tax=Priceomyces carsonii TaxID=28549 RepID=UPI002EDA7FDF|nr:unnamed protein product [Priceomyces carsonii]
MVISEVSSQGAIPSEKKPEEEYDVAYHYLRQRKGAEEPEHSVASITRKIDWNIMPLLCLIYFLQFLDKTLLNYAAVMGIKDNLKDNQFSNLGTIFYASYIFAEPFISYVLQRFPLSRALGICIFLWGAVLACHSACNSYASLMIVRTLLGAFESSSAVGIISISGMYYSKSEQASRMGIWCNMSGMGTIVGALLSFGFQHIRTDSFQSWQILFLVMGLVTAFFGVFVFFYLPNNVTSAWFLNDTEKICIIEHIRSNQTGIENKTFKREQLQELLFKDQFTWPLLLLTGTSQIVTGAVGTFSTTIISTFGYDNYRSALLQIPSGVIIIVIITTVTQLVSHFGHITYIMTSMFIPSIVGAIVLLCTDLTTQNLGNLFSIYLLYSGSSAITLIYIWNSANTAGYTKRIFRNALTLIMFCLSSLLGPQMFRASDFPKYTLAKVAILVTQAISVPLSLYIGFLSYRENERRDKKLIEKSDEDYEFLDSTDMQNLNFRYSF